METLPEIKTQPICTQCAKWFPQDIPDGCAASEWQSTGPCKNMHDNECTCYGTEVDGGLCEACYLLTK